MSRSTCDLGSNTDGSDNRGDNNDLADAGDSVDLTDDLEGDSVDLDDNLEGDSVDLADD